MKSKMPRVAGFTLIEIMIVVGIIGLLAAIAMPNFIRARLKTQQTVCINNLRQIDGAKNQWALENNAGGTAAPIAASLQIYLGRGSGSLLICPADTAKTFATSYGINDLQSAPVCLVVPGDGPDDMAHCLPN